MDEDARQAESRAGDDIRLLYQISVADIAFSKDGQLKLTNYVVLASAAAAAGWRTASVAIDPPPLFVCAQYGLCVLVVLAVALGIRFLYRLQSDIAFFRGRLLACRMQMSPEFISACDVRHGTEYARFRHQADLFFVLIAVQVVAGTFSLGLILLAKPGTCFPL